ncbi:MAG: lipocalin family protein [Rikenella sp.]|nr:lipocalin family protein [Rikenella sp.]
MKVSIFSLTTALGAAIFSISCDSTIGAIEGAWTEPNPIDPATQQGFRLHPDGTAESIGMETLVFQGWSLADDRTLVLTGESIGNGRTIPVADTLTIERLDADSLVLSDGTGTAVWRLGREK